MNREQWLKARLGGIGASEAAVIMGLSSYKTNVELWEEKTGRKVARDISGQARVEFGKAAEGPIRELFKLDFPEYAVTYDEFGMIRNNPDAPFAFATLDGELTHIETGRKGILEIKTSEIMRGSQWAQWDGRIPDLYFCQVLHQLMATGYDFVILKARLKSWRDGVLKVEARHYTIECTDEGIPEMIGELMKKEAAFWRCVEENKRPPLILPPI